MDGLRIAAVEPSVSIYERTRQPAATPDERTISAVFTLFVSSGRIKPVENTGMLRWEACSAEDWSARQGARVLSRVLYLQHKPAEAPPPYETGTLADLAEHGAVEPVPPPPPAPLRPVPHDDQDDGSGACRGALVAALPSLLLWVVIVGAAAWIVGHYVLARAAGRMP